MNLIKTFIMSSNGEQKGAWDFRQNIWQKFPMQRTSCHVESHGVAYYVYPWSSTILINICIIKWKIVLFIHLPNIRLLQSSELKKGQLKGDVHELITTRNINLTFNFLEMGDNLKWLEEPAFWRKLQYLQTQWSSF